MTEAEAAALKRWHRLPLRRQWETADRVARERGRALRLRIGGVVSLGPGFRTRGKGERTEEVVLRFLVVKKWRKRGTRRGAVPCFVRAFVAKGRSRCLVVIPTDVFEAPRMRPQAGGESPVGVRVRWAGSSGSVSGAACCLVADADNPETPYLLSCHHVLTGSLEHAGCGPRAGCVAYEASTGNRIGPVVDWTELVPSSGYSLDIALAQVEDLDAAKRAIGHAQAERLWSGGAPPSAYSILTARRVIQAGFLSQQYDLNLPYPCGATVRVRRTIESTADTRPGDSGAPLLTLDTSSGESALLGMHFYGSFSGTSLALDVRTLFDPGVFGKRLELL